MFIVAQGLEVVDFRMLIITSSGAEAIVDTIWREEELLAPPHVAAPEMVCLFPST